jgi:DNA topoisomerase-1
MNLVLVESPTKSKTIQKFLSSDYVVRASFGHIRDLPQKQLGIDIKNNFIPKYIIPPKAKSVVSQLKNEAKKAEKIILATDEDREGEAIAWHLIQALKLEDFKIKNRNSKQTENTKINNPIVERIVFHEITKSAIEEALKNPRKINLNLVNAQQARRILDRLVGYKLSPFLWRKVARGLSAGRVQSVAVRLIVEREKEIEKFIPQEYWTISALLQKLKTSKNEILDLNNYIVAELVKVGDRTLDKLDIKTKNEASLIISNLQNAEYLVESINKKEESRSPLPPFITSTLQQEAAKKLGFSSKQTMALAQQLYETGYITYMRTDSVNLSQESIKKAGEYIINQFGKKYFESKTYKTKSKTAQEAHEAIRPTEPSRDPESIKNELNPQQYKLYNLIWKRFIASQMPPAIFDATSINIVAKPKTKYSNSNQFQNYYTFRANGSTLKFDGFLKIYPIKFSEKELPIVEEGENLKLKELKPEQHFTKPPPRYNEASLIKILEKEGIGRPSTYATIISTIQQRNYVKKDKSKYFHPTEIGIMVTDILVNHFPAIVDIKFTSKMEDDLDKIAAGEKSWVLTIKEFYEPFEENLEKKYVEVNKNQIIPTEKTNQKCDKCGNDMVVRIGKYGKFIACSNYPECKNILKNQEKKEPPKETGELCEKCGGKMVIRKSRFGEFKACSNYPTCKNTKRLIEK